MTERENYQVFSVAEVLINSTITMIIGDLGRQPEMADRINSILTRIIGIHTDTSALINIIITMIVGKQTEAATASEFIRKNIYVFSAIILCYSYCYLVSSGIPEMSKIIFKIMPASQYYSFLSIFHIQAVGMIISLIPIFCLLTFLPFYLPPSFSSIIVAALIAWPSIGRLILFAFGKGPISSRSLKNFIVSTALPIQTPNSFKPSTENASGSKILINAVLVGLLSQFKEVLHPGVLYVAYGVFLYLYLEFVGASAKSMFRGLFGLELMTMFDEPYLSTSVQDFWGRRWNLVVSSNLRESVYKPVRSAAAVYIGKELAPAPAIMATFMISGLTHELLLLCLTRANPTGEMTAFFVLHGIFVVLEVMVKKALKFAGVNNIDLPGWFKFVSRLLTVGFVLLTGALLFFPPVIRGGGDRMVCREFQYWRELVGL